MLKGIKFPKFYGRSQVKKIQAQINLKKQKIEDLKKEYGLEGKLLKDRPANNEPKQMP